MVRSLIRHRIQACTLWRNRVASVLFGWVWGRDHAMLYTLWKINYHDRSAVTLHDGTRDDLLTYMAQLTPAPGVRYEVLPAGGAPFDAPAETTDDGEIVGGESEGNE